MMLRLRRLRKLPEASAERSQARERPRRPNSVARLKETPYLIPSPLSFAIPWLFEHCTCSPLSTPNSLSLLLRKRCSSPFGVELRAVSQQRPDHLYDIIKVEETWSVGASWGLGKLVEADFTCEFLKEGPVVDWGTLGFWDVVGGDCFGEGTTRRGKESEQGNADHGSRGASLSQQAGELGLGLAEELGLTLAGELQVLVKAGHNLPGSIQISPMPGINRGEEAAADLDLVRVRSVRKLQCVGWRWQGAGAAQGVVLRVQVGVDC
ncbi:hypothetical protein Droror1_Dr00010399 [Drosera rotundifolia]